ncbi:hypothetical protein SMICM304S_01980 [Streptomyces microflavus]
MEQTALELGAEVGREDGARTVDQEGHLVPDQTDVGVRVGENGE